MTWGMPLAGRSVVGLIFLTTAITIAIIATKAASKAMAAEFDTRLRGASSSFLSMPPVGAGDVPAAEGRSSSVAT
jgi:hypothetical protein